MRLPLLQAAVCVLLGAGGMASAIAAGAGASSPPAAATPSVEQGARWTDLTAAEKSALQPLEQQWSTIDVRSKAKWLELSDRFPKMTAPEKSRVQERMSEWTRLTPSQRGEARANFQQAKQWPAQDRQARWDAYQALPAERRQQLAAGGTPTASPPASAPQRKSNIVSNPAFAAAPKAVAPTVVQAKPGASTTLITKRPSPPGHQQTGLPKIAATPEFVDKATLLPQRGPQGAATRPVAAASSVSSR